MSLNRFIDSLHDPEFDISDKSSYVLRHQIERSSVYSKFAEQLDDLEFPIAPYMPIEIFKRPEFLSEFSSAEIVFKSSGTGGNRSSHPVMSSGLYRETVIEGFTSVFGEGPFTFASHLPGYRESGAESSLLFMVEHLISKLGSGNKSSFLENTDSLRSIVHKSENEGRQLVVFGAAFGLAHFCEHSKIALPPDAIVIETGGMKTFRSEINRADLHDFLSSSFQLDRSQIYSEYGMCELLSQCYTRGGSGFYAPNWLDVRIVNPERPWVEAKDGAEGAIAVFDCANVHSLSAILTGDAGIANGDSFEVLGRLHQSDLRGCNFLIEDLLYA